MAALCKLEEVADSFAPYVKELHDFFRSRGVAFGCAADVGPVVERLETDGDFRDEMSSMVRAIMYRQRDGLERGELFDLVLAAVGGAAMKERGAEFEEAVGRLRAFVNGVFRSRWSSAVEDRRGTELHGAMLASAEEEREWTVPGVAMESMERKPRGVVADAESGGMERSAAAGSAEGHSSTTLFYRARVVAAGLDDAEWPVEDGLMAHEEMPVSEEEIVAPVKAAEMVEAGEAIEAPVMAEQAVEALAIEPAEIPVAVEAEVVAESAIAEEPGAGAESPAAVEAVAAHEVHEVVEPTVLSESPVAIEAAAPWAAPVRGPVAPLVPAVAKARSQLKIAHANEFSWFEPVERRRRTGRRDWLWMAGFCVLVFVVTIAVIGRPRRAGFRATPVRSGRQLKPVSLAPGQQKPRPGVQRLSDAQVAAMIAQAEQRGRTSAAGDEDKDEAELVKESEALAAAPVWRGRRARRVVTASAPAGQPVAVVSGGTQPAAAVVRQPQPSVVSAVRATAGVAVDGAAGVARVPRYAVPPGAMAGRLVYAPAPKYPALAKLMHVEGRVVVAEVVARDGQVMEAKVLSGHKLLRGAALRAVEERRYRPYVLDDRASEVVTTAVVEFRLGR